MLIKVNKKEFALLPNMNEKEYHDFLENKILLIQQDTTLKNFKINQDQDLYRLLTATPYLYENNKKIKKYDETPEQRKVRLRLKKYYNELYTKKVSKPIVVDQVESIDGGVLSTTVETLLNITRRTLYSLRGDEEENNFDMYTKDKRLYVDKKSLLAYLDRYHYCSTGLKMEQMYSLVKKISYGKKGETILKEQLDDILNSDECKNKWKQYYETVPENQRVFRMAKQIRMGKMTIYQVQNFTNDFEKYNPNIKICDDHLTEIPQLFTAGYWAAILGVGERTVLRYCELGYLPHYRIGGKAMISIDDFNSTSTNLDNITTRKHQSGRKKKIEFVFTDEIVKNEKVIEKFKDTKNFQRFRDGVLEIESLATKIKELQERQEQETDETIKEEIKNELKATIASRERLLKAITQYRKAFFSDNLFIESNFEKAKPLIENYYEKRKDLKVYTKHLEEALKAKKPTASHLQLIINDLTEDMKNVREQILNIII